MAKELFRKVALERMSSPEQLDQMITVTTPVGWLALLALGGLLLAAIFWGVVGRVPTPVQGRGILLEKEGIASVQTENSGTITAIYTEVGDLIEQGEIIARIRQGNLVEQIKNIESELERLKFAYSEGDQNLAKENAIQLQALAKQEANQQQAVRNLEVRLQQQNALKQEKIELKQGLENLLKDGIVAKSKVLEIEHEINEVVHAINQTKLEIEKVKNQLKTLVLERSRIQHSEDSQQLSQQQRIEAKQNEIALLKRKFAQNSQIVSSYGGKVLEVSIKEGNVINAGTSIMLVEQGEGAAELEAVLYFSPAAGKQIRTEMKAQISPSTVKQEEFGFIEGTVINVDEFPSTSQKVMQTLQNQALAQMLTSNAAPIRVVVSLERDQATPSGYKWSSYQGPEIQIDSNTICSANVTVKEQAPVTLVIPVLKKFLLGTGSGT